jgi:hypothetical protein
MGIRVPNDRSAAGSARQLTSVTNLYLAPGEGIAQILKFVEVQPQIVGESLVE